MGNAASNELHLFSLDEVFKVSFFTRREVIDNGDLVATLYQLIGQMRADKASPAGNHYFHHYFFLSDIACKIRSARLAPLSR